MNKLMIILPAVVVVIVAIFAVLLSSHVLSPSTAYAKSVPIVYSTQIGNIITTFPSLSMSISLPSGQNSFLNETIGYKLVNTTGTGSAEVYDLNLTASNSSFSSNLPVFIYSNGSIDGLRELSTMNTSINGSINSTTLNYKRGILSYELIALYLSGNITKSISQNTTIYNYLSNSSYSETIGTVKMNATKYTLTSPFGNPTSNIGRLDSLSMTIGEPYSGPSTEILLNLNARVTTSYGTMNVYININSLST